MNDFLFTKSAAGRAEPTVCVLNVSFEILVSCLAHAFVPEADSGFRQSQASRIWRELEEEEEGHSHRDAVGFFQSMLRRRQRSPGGGEVEEVVEEEDRAEGMVAHHRWGRSSRRRSESGYGEDDCRWFFVLATLVAALALFVSLVYPLLSKLGLRCG